MITRPFLLAALFVLFCASNSFAQVQHLAKGQPLDIKYPYTSPYTGGASNALVDGLRGSEQNAKNGWQGYQGDDLIATIDLGAEQTIAEIRVGFLRHHEAEIFIPRTVTFETSLDGRKFKKAASFEHFESMERSGLFARDFVQRFNNEKARFVRVRAENLAFVTDWHKGAGDQAWLLCDELIVSATATQNERDMQGVWFSAEAYEETPLPEFANIRDELPTPVLDDSLMLALYWWCWEQAFNNLRTPEPGSGFVANYVDESFSENIFQWDTHFMLLYWKYAHHIFPAIQSHDNFYAHQHSNGYICRELREADGTDFIFKDVDHTINPPLFAWTEWEWFRHTGDPSRFSKIFAALEHYGQWIDGNRVFPGTPHLLYWNTSYGSGMDNSPRQGLAWVDMSTQMAMHYEALGKMALYLDDEQRYLAFADLRNRIGSTINHFMWNEEDGLYYDLDPMNGHEKFKTAACFWPMLAGISDSTKANRMVDNLLDPEQFLTKVPFATLTPQHELYHQEGNYWRGGVWAPTNYMIIKGMHRAGFHDRAGLASEAYLEAMKTVFANTGTVWENYAPEYLKQGKKAKQDFVGWSALGPIALLIESVIGIDVDAPTNTITWNIHRTDVHGVEDLRFGKENISLIYDPNRGNPVISVDSEVGFRLVIAHQGIETLIEVQPGENDYPLE